MKIKKEDCSRKRHEKNVASVTISRVWQPILYKVSHCEYIGALQFILFVFCILLLVLILPIIRLLWSVLIPFYLLYFDNRLNLQKTLGVDYWTKNSKLYSNNQFERTKNKYAHILLHSGKSII